MHFNFGMSEQEFKVLFESVEKEEIDYQPVEETEETTQEVVNDGSN